MPNNKKLYMIVFFSWTFWMAFSFIYSKTRREIYPAMVMPAFPHSKWEGDTIRFNDTEWWVKLPNGDSVSVEPRTIFKHVPGFSHLKKTITHIIQKKNAYNRAIIHPPSFRQWTKDSIEYQQFLTYIHQRLATEYKLHSPDKLIIDEYSAIYLKETHSLTNKLFKRRTEFKL